MLHPSTCSFMNMTGFSFIESNVYFLDIVLLTKGISVMTLSIDVYVLLIMLHFSKIFLISQLRQILIFHFFNLPFPLLLPVLNLYQHLLLSLALDPLPPLSMYLFHLHPEIYTGCHFLLHECHSGLSPLYSCSVFVR